MTREREVELGRGARADSGPWSRRIAGSLFVLGSCGLLGAMLVDTAAVIGRHVGWPLLGSIELVEACVVCMASAALLGATLERGHASVHIVTERLSPAGRRALDRLSNALSALFFGAVLAGSLILVADLWQGDERSELLGIPIAPLRWLFCASTVAIVAVFTARALSRRSPP